MDISDLIRSASIADGPPRQDPFLRQRAIRSASAQPLTAIDDALLTAASRLILPNSSVKAFLFDSIYQLCQGQSTAQMGEVNTRCGIDYVLTALTLFTFCQIGLRRYMPSGRQVAVQIGPSAAADAFAVACAVNPYQPACLHLLDRLITSESQSSPSEASYRGWWARLFRRKPASIVETGVDSLVVGTGGDESAPSDPMRRALMRSLNFINVPTPSLLDTSWRWRSDLHRIIVESSYPEFVGEERLGVLSLVLLKEPRDYLNLLQRALPRLTETSAVLLCLPANWTNTVAASIALAFPRAPAANRIDYPTVVGGEGAWEGRRTILHWPGSAFDPPPVPVMATVKLLPQPDRMVRLIEPAHPAFTGVKIEIDPVEIHECAPPLFIDGEARMLEQFSDDLRLTRVVVPAHYLVRLDSGAVSVGLTRHELYRRAVGRFDPANVAKAPMFATMVQDSAGNVVSPVSRAFDRHHYIHDGEDGTPSILVPTETSRHIAGDSVLVYGSEANSHWLLEGVLPLYCLDRIGLDGRTTFILTHDAQPYQREMLEKLGIDSERIVSTRIAERITCDRLFASDLTWKINQGMVALANRITVSTGAAPYDRHGRRYGTHLYVARTDARWLRRFLNENEIIAALEEMGFDIVVPSQLSVLELLAIFGQARVIVGPQGAGLLNSLFSPPGTDVIMLTAERYYETSLKRVAAAKGHRLGVICGESLVSDDRVFRGAISDWLIDVDAVVRRLALYV